MNAAENDAAIRRWAAERRLPEAHLARWLSLAQRDRAEIFHVTQALRLRTGQFATIFELLEEISVRELKPPGAILARPEIRRILDGTGSAPERAKHLIEALRAIRFPRLKRTAQEFATRIAALKLPRGITVVLPRELASDEVRIQISARAGAELKRLLEAAAGKAAELGRIADLMGGQIFDDDEL